MPGVETARERYERLRRAFLNGAWRWPREMLAESLDELVAAHAAMQTEPARPLACWCGHAMGLHWGGFPEARCHEIGCGCRNYYAPAEPAVHRLSRPRHKPLEFGPLPPAPDVGGAEDALCGCGHRPLAHANASGQCLYGFCPCTSPHEPCYICGGAEYNHRHDRIDGHAYAMKASSLPQMSFSGSWADGKPAEPDDGAAMRSQITGAIARRWADEFDADLEGRRVVPTPKRKPPRWWRWLMGRVSDEGY